MGKAGILFILLLAGSLAFPQICAAQSRLQENPRSSSSKGSVRQQTPPSRVSKPQTSQPKTSTRRGAASSSIKRSAPRSGVKVKVNTYTPIVPKPQTRTDTRRSSASYNKKRVPTDNGNKVYNPGNNQVKGNGSTGKITPAPQQPSSMGTRRPDFKYKNPKVQTPGTKMRRNNKAKSPSFPQKPGASDLRPLPQDDPDPDPDPGEDPNNNGGNNNEEEENKTIVIYCSCCGCPWCECMWCHYWTPVFWCYYGYDPYYWNDFWYSKKIYTIFSQYHDQYDFENSFPCIYSLPAMILDPTAEAIAFLDEGAELFRAGQYLEALHRFRLAALTDLNFAPPKFAYAHSLFALGMYDYAAYEIRLGLRLLPEWVEMGGDIKLMYGNLDDFTEQLKALYAHLKLFRDDEDAILCLGYVSFFSGDLYMAEKAFMALKGLASQSASENSSLFLNAIQKIKEQLRLQGTDNDALKDDGLSLFDLL